MHLRPGLIHGDDEAFFPQVRPVERLTGRKRMAGRQGDMDPLPPQFEAVAIRHLNIAGHEGEIEVAGANGVKVLTCSAVVNL
jgi:hypothetical protein